MGVLSPFREQITARNASINAVKRHDLTQNVTTLEEV